MKIYSKIIFDMKSGETFEEQSFDYSGDVALCGGSSGGGDTETTIRYAGYIEDKHKDFLNTIASYRASLTDDSPFADYTAINIDPAFFGTGYLISSFPSLYDMFGKFMAGLDIDVLYSQIFENTVNSPEINNLVSAEATMMDDDINMNVLPRFQTGMRDMNAVMSSSYVLGRAAIEDARVKALSRFSAELKYRMIPIATDRWKAHLGWNKTVVMLYSELMKLYYSTLLDTSLHNLNVAAKNKVWPFTILEFERHALGALQGARDKESEYEEKGGWMQTVSTVASLIGIAAMFF